MYIPQFNPRVRKNESSGLYFFEIRDNEGKTVEYQAGFKTKREAENAGLAIQQKLRQGFYKQNPHINPINKYNKKISDLQ